MLARINLILKSRNLNAAQFADEIGVQRSSVSHILTGRNNASLDFVLKVLQRYPELDTDWLLTGKGRMIRTNEPMEQILKNQSTDIGQKVVGNNQLEATGDLFHSLIESKPVIEPVLPPQATAPAITIQTEAANSPQKKPDLGGDQNPTVRQIEKIVILYSDRSFLEYHPNN